MIYTTLISFWISIFACIVQAVDFQVKVEPGAKAQGAVVVTGVASWNAQPNLWNGDNFDERQFAALAKKAYQLMGPALAAENIDARNIPGVMAALLVKDSPDNDKYNVYFGSSIKSFSGGDPGRLLSTINTLEVNASDPDGFTVVPARINTILRTCITSENRPEFPKTSPHRGTCGEPVALQKFRKH